MIIKDALRSLRNNLSRAFFYWLTFVLTSSFIFLFFNISMSEEIGVTWINSHDDIATTVTVFVVAICSIDIFFANDFFVKNKAKDLAVRLVSGATYIQLASYLLIQTFLLLAIAVPCGVACSLLVLPFMNSWLMKLGYAFQVGIHFDAVVVTIIVLVFVIFWTTILNLSFAYRNAASMMLNSGTMLKLNAGSIINKKKTTLSKLEQVLSVVLFFVPLIFIFFNSSMSGLMSIVGMYGLNLMIQKVIIPITYKIVDQWKIQDANTVAFMGFLRSDLNSMKLNLMLHIVSVVILLSLMVSVKDSGLEMMLVMLSYIVLNILQSLCVMFRFSTETVVRRKYFATLLQIGFLPKELRAAVRNEVMVFYGFSLVTALLYLGDIFIALARDGASIASMAPQLLGMFLIPMILCGFLSFRYYLKVVEPVWNRKQETMD